jgi:hypothetical protein
MNWFRDVCGVCFLQVHDAETLIALGVLVLVFSVFGVTLIAAERYVPAAQRTRSNVLGHGFSFWLGTVMLHVAALKVILLGSILVSSRQIDLWVLIFFALGAVLAVLAFIAWGRDQQPSALNDGGV